MSDLDAVPLSALQHWAYCPRQCALIHLEQAFDDNLHTLRGNALHARVDQPDRRQEYGLRVERALPLWHDTLGLIGKADAVEFARDGTARPVEYKQGSRHKAADIAACDDIQLAAQALCLEAMTGRPVAAHAVSAELHAVLLGASFGKHSVLLHRRPAGQYGLLEYFWEYFSCFLVAAGVASMHLSSARLGGHRRCATQ